MTKYLYHRRTHLNRDSSDTAGAVFVVGHCQPSFLLIASLPLLNLFFIFFDEFFSSASGFTSKKSICHGSCYPAESKRVQNVQPAGSSDRERDGDVGEFKRNFP